MSHTPPVEFPRIDEDRSSNRPGRASGNASDLATAAADGDLSKLASGVARGQHRALGADGWGVLHHAAFHGQARAVDLLLDAGTDPNQRSEHGCVGASPLQCAVAGRREEVVALLLRRGADPEARDEAGYTALLLAAEVGDLALLKALLRAGADVRAEVGECGPLTLARRGGHGRAVALLRQCRAIR